MEKLSVTVFGLKDESVAGGCDCAGACGPTPTMGELYDGLVKFIDGSDLAGKVEMKFIDVMEEQLDGYQSVKEYMQKGYALPLTSINGEMKLYGGISNEMVYDNLKSLAN